MSEPTIFFILVDPSLVVSLTLLGRTDLVPTVLTILFPFFYKFKHLLSASEILQDLCFASGIFVFHFYCGFIFNVFLDHFGEILVGEENRVTMIPVILYFLGVIILRSVCHLGMEEFTIFI